MDCGRAPHHERQTDVEGYVAYLAKNNLKLIGIFLTHPHADFVAGHTELSARSGAPILISEKAPATFVHCDVREGDRISVGFVEMEVIATPGHSPDSISLCLFESGIPVALFSGDTLFAGDVGRPDLRDRDIGSYELAGMLYRSLFDKLLRETDFVCAVHDDRPGSRDQLGAAIE